MRISVWSSDVCSSDLRNGGQRRHGGLRRFHPQERLRRSRAVAGRNADRGGRRHRPSGGRSWRDCLARADVDRNCVVVGTRVDIGVDIVGVLFIKQTTTTTLLILTFLFYHHYLS